MSTLILFDAACAVALNAAVASRWLCNADACCSIADMNFGALQGWKHRVPWRRFFHCPVLVNPSVIAVGKKMSRLLHMDSQTHISPPTTVQQLSATVHFRPPLILKLREREAFSHGITVETAIA